MGRVVNLGQEGGAAVTISPDGKTITWSVPPELPEPVRLWVTQGTNPRTLQAQGRGGVENPPWVTAGHLWRWDITAGENNALQAAIHADTRNGFPLTMTVIPVTPPPHPPVVPAAATEIVAPPAPSPGPSWFQQQTVAGVPNTYLAVGMGLGVLLLFRKKR